MLMQQNYPKPYPGFCTNLVLISCESEQIDSFVSRHIQEGIWRSPELRIQCENGGTKPTVVIWAKASTQERSKLSRRHRLCRVNIIATTMEYRGCSWLEDTLNYPWSESRGHVLDSAGMPGRMMGRISVRCKRYPGRSRFPSSQHIACQPPERNKLSRKR